MLPLSLADMVQQLKLPTGILVAALLGGGGTSFVLPRVAPDWYRPDPATGTELRSLRREVNELRFDFHEFLRDGPRRVTENQTRMEAKIDNILEEIHRRGEEHRTLHHNPK